MKCHLPEVPDKCDTKKHRIVEWPMAPEIADKKIKCKILHLTNHC